MSIEWKDGMEFIDCFDEKIIARGYSYYASDKVLDLDQTDTYEYCGIVAGSGKDPYNVAIDLRDVQKSKCDCPYAEGGHLCKHMAALWMAAFPDKAECYEFYDDEDYYDYCDDEDEDFGYYEEVVDLKSLRERLAEGQGTMYYEELLDDFLDTLSASELRQLLRTELKRDRDRTFEVYLKQRYKSFISNRGGISELLDSLNSRLILMGRRDDYDWKDYSQPILSEKEKNAILTLWNTKEQEKEFNNLFMKESLAVYDDYRWIAGQLLEHLSEEERILFARDLEGQLDYLKSSGLKSTAPKSNVLIATCIIMRPDYEEMADIMVRNSKYPEFVRFCIENSNDKRRLYDAFVDKLKKSPHRNRLYVPAILYRFYELCGDEDLLGEYYLYDFLNNCDVEPLEHLKENECMQKYEGRIEKLTKSLKHLVTLYRFTGETEKLYNLLMEKGSRQELICNVDVLCEKYEDKLREYFTRGFYSSLNGEKNRKVYHDAAGYIEGLAKLKQGNAYVDRIIEQLQDSRYAKCRTLFEEIDIAAGRKELTVKDVYRYRYR